MDKQKSLKISILGKSYLINTDEAQEEVFAAANMVDRMLKEQMAKVSVSDEGKIAVVIALQLATDLSKALGKLTGLENKVEYLSNLIDNKLQ
jgi:cell division protein ZapA (FtsZ GTPase activity inhibitor)